MNINNENLMKHFASVLRNRASGKEKAPSISEQNVRFLSRKQLIDIVKKRYQGTIPKELNLVEMENIELLNVIGDELFIMAYVIEHWCNNVLTKQHVARIAITKETPKNLKPIKDDKISKQTKSN